MSLIDANLVFSDNQDVSASAISGNVLDLAAAPTEQQFGFMYFNVKVGNTAVTGDTLTISLFTVGGGSAPTDQTSATILAEVTIADGVGVAGAGLLSIQIPTKLLLRWVAVYYTDAGSVSAGRVDAWFGMEPINQSLTIQKETV